MTLQAGSATAVLIEDDGATALDTQRDALVKESAEQDKLRGSSNSGTFDNLSRLQDRRDQSRIEIVSGGDVIFRRARWRWRPVARVVSDGPAQLPGRRARVDVSGAVGVQVAMESNNVKVKVQGNELRDSPDNRDSGKLISSEVDRPPPADRGRCRHRRL